MFDFAILPPEVNSGLMYAGPGSGPMMTAAAAWDSLAADLYSTATSFQSVVSGLTGGPWLGPSSSSMAAAAAPFVAWMNTTATHAAQVGAQAKAAAGAYETAFAAHVPPPVIAANRALQMALIATNFFGQNTPAIFATEAHYLEMWVQDALAMFGYATSSHQATALTSFDPPPTAPAGPATMAAAAVPAATSSGTNVLAGLSGLTSLLHGGLGSLTSGSISLTGIPGFAELEGILKGAGLGALLPTSISTSALIQGIYLGSIPARFALYPLSMLTSLARGGLGGATGLGAGLPNAATLMESINSAITAKVQPIAGLLSARLTSAVQGISAQLGQAHSVGALSVPQGWSTAAPVMSRAAPVLPTTPVSAPAVSAPSAGMPGGPYGQALMGALSGRGLGNLAAKVPPKVIPRSPAGG